MISFIRINQASEKSDFDPKSFSLSAKSTTDIYCSPIPPAKYIYSAPNVHTNLPKSSFSSARLSISFCASIQFDQAGLLFTVPTKSNPVPNATNSTVVDSHPAYIKAGIEVNDGKAWISVVARGPEGWCDWSLFPLMEEKKLPATVSVTIEVARYKNALLIWKIEKERALIRKVPWVFLNEDVGNVWVGAYAARPDPDAEASGRALEVDFQDLVIEMKD